MDDFFGNSQSDYAAYPKTSDYESLAQSTSYMQQSTVHPQKTAEFEYKRYNHATSWIQDSALSMPERLCIHENEMAAQSAQYCYPGSSDKQSFWPMEYFSTPSGQEFLSEYFGPPSPTMTPGCMSYTPSSSSMDDDSSNVFDMQFGDALDYSSLSDPERSFRQSHLTYLERLDSSSSSCPSSPATSDSQEYKYIRSSRRSPTRTPSPSCSENGSSSSDHRRRFPCLLAGCSRRFTSQYTLRVHMEAHKPKPKVYFPCTEGCSERFSRQHDRLRHEVSKHGKVCEFSCEECGRFFSSSKTLGNHKCPFAQGATRWVHS